MHFTGQTAIKTLLYEIPFGRYIEVIDSHKIDVGERNNVIPELKFVKYQCYNKN